MNIGIIGCGNISTTYLRLAPQFQGIDIVACSDINESAARAQADAFGCRAVSIDHLLADPDIQAIINLTIPAAHAEVSRRILEAGKHVYSEKPYVLNTEEGLALQALAERRSLRIGSAPDTFLGGAHQMARQCIESGEVGDIIGGTCFMMNHGMESWHPNPDFFYQPGGGPMLDIGPYYISNLIQLIGPVKRLMAMASTPFATRTIGSEARAGERVPVGTPTSISTLLEFYSGATVTVCFSWDVWQHGHSSMELYGTKATLHVPDPNFFGGELVLATDSTRRTLAIEHPFAVINDSNNEGESQANYRGAGLADMIQAVEQNRAHRCSGQLALHAIEIMTGALQSAQSGQAVELTTRCERPEPLDAAAAQSLLR